MNFMKIALVIIPRVVCATGMTMGALGTVSLMWFVFFSANDMRFYWAVMSVAGICIGYFVYRFSLRYIYDEWDDYH